MPDDRIRFKPMTLIAAVLGFGMAVPPALADQAERGTPDPAASLYVRKPSLQETMLATRSVYAAAMPRQADARGAVAFGPWHQATVPVPNDIIAQGKIDLAAKSEDGKKDNDNDSFSITVLDPDTLNVVFEASATLDGGNVQIHPPNGSGK